MLDPLGPKRCFPSGGAWESSCWHVQINAVISGYDGRDPCRHCGQSFRVSNRRSDGEVYTLKHWVCPRVVVAFNEGGYSTTGVCLDCILEAAKTL